MRSICQVYFKTQRTLLPPLPLLAKGRGGGDRPSCPPSSGVPGYKCSSSGSPTEHGSVETTTEAAEDVLLATARSSSASFHLTTVKLVLIAVGCLFLLVSVVIIAFILDVKRHSRQHSRSKQVLLPETVIASSTKSVPQSNSAQNHVSSSTEFAVKNPNQYPEMSLGHF